MQMPKCERRAGAGLRSTHELGDEPLGHVRILAGAECIGYRRKAHGKAMNR